MNPKLLTQPASWIRARLARRSLGGRSIARAVVSEPARRAPARRAIRTALVTLAAFGIGRWFVDSVAVAVFAFDRARDHGNRRLRGHDAGEAGGDRGDRNDRDRVDGTRDVDLIAGVVAGCAVMFFVVALVALASLLSGYAAAGANALILFYVVAAGSAAPTSAIAERLEGVGLGGALALVAALVLWPELAHPRTLRHLGAAVRSLTSRLRRTADATSQSGDSAPRMLGIRAEVDALVDRPAAPTAIQRAELYLMNDIERLDDYHQARADASSGEPQSRNRALGRRRPQRYRRGAVRRRCDARNGQSRRRAVRRDRQPGAVLPGRPAGGSGRSRAGPRSSGARALPGWVDRRRVQSGTQAMVAGPTWCTGRSDSGLT